MNQHQEHHHQHHYNSQVDVVIEDAALMADPSTARLRAGKTAALPSASFPVPATSQAKPKAIPQGHAGVFGRKNNWADQIAEDELFANSGNLQNIAPMTLAATARSSSIHAPTIHAASLAQRPPSTTAGSRYIMPSQQPVMHPHHQQQQAGSMSKPPSPVDPAQNQVKFVNSTVENLQNQIKKEEAPKKKRTRTSPEQLRILQKAFQTDPMPSSSARLALSKKLGMNARAVQVWFQNRRAKAKRADSLGGAGHQDSYDDDDADSQGGYSEEQDQPTPGQFMRPSGNRAASMSSMPISYAPEMNGFYNAQMGQNVLGMDAASFFEPIEQSHYESELGGGANINGMDYATNGYGSFYGSSYPPVQGMFSLPPGTPYDLGGGSNAMDNQQAMMKNMGYGSYQSNANSLSEDLLPAGMDFGGATNGDEPLLGSINPLSAFLDNNDFDMNNTVFGVSDLNAADSVGGLYGGASSAAVPIPSASRRSFSLNDIHSQLTLQQIQTLESVGLPSLGQRTGGLGAIREAEEVSSAEAPSGRTSGGGFVQAQDSLLTTPIDDLRMSAFWDGAAE
jgi:hypothetical protein